MPALRVLRKLPAWLAACTGYCTEWNIPVRRNVGLSVAGRFCPSVVQYYPQDRDTASHSTARTRRHKDTATQSTARTRRHTEQQEHGVTDYSKDTESQSTVKTRSHTEQQGHGVIEYSKDTASQSTAKTRRHTKQQGHGVTEYSKGAASQSIARTRRHTAQQGHGVTEYSKDTASHSTARTRRHTAQQGHGVTEHSKDTASHHSARTITRAGISFCGRRQLVDISGPNAKVSSWVVLQGTGHLMLPFCTCHGTVAVSDGPQFKLLFTAVRACVRKLLIAGRSMRFRRKITQTQVS